MVTYENRFIFNIDNDCERDGGGEPTQNCCTCYPLSVTFAPAPLLSTWKCINNCVPTCCTDWLLLILWLGLPWQPQRNPCSAFWLGYGQQVRSSSAWMRKFTVRRQTTVQICILVGCTSSICPNRINICLKHDFVHMSWTESWTENLIPGIERLRRTSTLKWSVNNAHNHSSLSLLFPIFLSFHAF